MPVTFDWKGKKNEGINYIWKITVEKSYTETRFPVVGGIGGQHVFVAQFCWSLHEMAAPHWAPPIY